MTIDERLDRLTERTDAIAESAELLLLEGREQDKRIDKVVATLGPVIEAVNKLANIAASHERRLGNLEGTA